MSQQACTEFFAKINTDAALQQEVTTALEGKEGDEATNAFVWVGAKHGYEFTAAEATQKYQEIIAAAEGELDSEALDQVAGGRGDNSDLASNIQKALQQDLMDQIMNEDRTYEWGKKLLDDRGMYYSSSRRVVWRDRSKD